MPDFALVSAAQRQCPVTSDYPVFQCLGPKSEKSRDSFRKTDRPTARPRNASNEDARMAATNGAARKKEKTSAIARTAPREAAFVSGTRQSVSMAPTSAWAMVTPFTLA